MERFITALVFRHDTFKIVEKRFGRDAPNGRDAFMGRRRNQHLPTM